MQDKRNRINMAKKKKKKKKRKIVIRAKDAPTVKTGRDRKFDLKEKGVLSRDNVRKKDSQSALKPIQKDSTPNENLIYRAIKTPFESNRKKH